MNVQSLPNVECSLVDDQFGHFTTIDNRHLELIEITFVKLMSIVCTIVLNLNMYVL